MERTSRQNTPTTSALIVDGGIPAVTNWNMRYAFDKGGSVDDLFEQLSEDFPEDSLDWVKKEKWEGPKLIHTEDIDYSNAKSWQASHEPDKVHRFMKKIKKGNRRIYRHHRTAYGLRERLHRKIHWLPFEPS